MHLAQHRSKLVLRRDLFQRQLQIADGYLVVIQDIVEQILGTGARDTRGSRLIEIGHMLNRLLSYYSLL